MDGSTLELVSICLYVFCTLFAACVGSFSNVVIYRVPAHQSIAWPPSSCPKCGKRIKPYDNIPVISWVLLRGKCRNCRASISVQYVLIEAICGVMGFFLCHQIFAPHLETLFLDGVFWRLLLLFCSMTFFVVGCLVLAVIDYRTTEIPPEIALPLGGLGVLTAIVLPESWPYIQVLGNIGWLDSLLGALFGGGFVVAIIGLYYLATKRIGMGGGDVWMMAMVGAMLGWQSLPFVFFAASVQGIVVAVIGMCAGKKQQTEQESGLFRNRVASEIEAEVHGSESAIAQTAQEDESIGKLAVPFGPFIAVASIEYVFFGKYLLPLMSGNTLSPWGFMAW